MRAGAAGRAVGSFPGKEAVLESWIGVGKKVWRYWRAKAFHCFVRENGVRRNKEKSLSRGTKIFFKRFTFFSQAKKM